MNKSQQVDEMTIQHITKRGKHDNEDRLSDFSDCILIHILSFLSTKDVVRTCILSKRWMYIWKYIPSLRLHCSNFSSLKSFDKFVSRILSLRRSSIVLQTVYFERSGSIEFGLLKRVANYVLSHSAKLDRLEIDVKGDICHILPCISSSHTLRSLRLYVSPKGRYNYGRTVFSNSLDLPALTCLHLGNFAFCATDDGQIDPFSAFNSLSDLIIDNCSVKGAYILCISSQTLVSLTMRNHSFDNYQIELSAPSLRTFAFTGIPYQTLLGTNLSSVKKVIIDAEMLANYLVPPLVLLSWLSSLANIESLTVSASTLQVLFLAPDILKDAPALLSLRSLKSVKVMLKPLSYGLSMTLKTLKLEQPITAGFEPYQPIPNGTLDLLCRNSQSADVDIINCSRLDDSFDRLPPLSSSLFPQFLQPSSWEHVIADLNLRIGHLSQALQQVLDLEKEDIVLERHVFMATKKHIRMLSKTSAALGRQMHEALGLPL